MKKVFLLLIIPTIIFSQYRSSNFRGSGGGSGSLDLSTLLPIIADSTDWTAGSTVNAIKPKGAKTVEADSVKAGSLEVTGNARFNGNVTMITTAGEQVQLGTGSDAAPELSSAGDTDTGIRFAGGNKMQLVQGGLNSHTFSPYRYTQTYSDGDTISISLDGSLTKIVSSANIEISTPSFGYLLTGTARRVVWTSTYLYPSFDDSYELGRDTGRFQLLRLSDYLYLGGKGQTATQYISKENTIAGGDSSMVFRIGSDGNPYMRWAAADADSARLHVRGDSTEFYSKNALALDVPAVVTRAKAVIGDSLRVNKTSKLIGNVEVGTGTGWFTAEDSLLSVVGDISLDGFKVSKIDTVFTATYVPRWVKYTSGAKSWYCPVYADTTGKW